MEDQGDTRDVLGTPRSWADVGPTEFRYITGAAVKRNVRVCEACWAIVQGLARQRVSEPPNGGTCELCESRPAVVIKGMMTEGGFQSWHEELSPGMATEEEGRYRPRGWAAVDYAFVTLGGAICMVKVMTPDVDPLLLAFGLVLVIATVVRGLLPAR